MESSFPPQTKCKQEQTNFHAHALKPIRREQEKRNNIEKPMLKNRENKKNPHLKRRILIKQILSSVIPMTKENSWVKTLKEEKRRKE